MPPHSETPCTLTSLAAARDDAHQFVIGVTALLDALARAPRHHDPARVAYDTMLRQAKRHTFATAFANDLVRAMAHNMERDPRLDNVWCALVHNEERESDTFDTVFVALLDVIPRADLNPLLAAYWEALVRGCDCHPCAGQRVKRRRCEPGGEAHTTDSERAAAALGGALSRHLVTLLPP